MEHFFTCPHCWEQISILLDTSVKEQTYVEDCEVCCRPIQVRYTTENEMVVSSKQERLSEPIQTHGRQRNSP